MYRLGMQDYRKLWIWQRAHVLAIQVRRATRGFPRAEYGPLRTQMIRAAESIVFNIVEGCGSRSPKEFARFLDISIKSSMELESQLAMAKDNGVLRPALSQSLTATTIEIRKMTCGLRKKVLRPPNQDPPNHD